MVCAPLIEMFLDFGRAGPKSPVAGLHTATFLQSQVMGGELHPDMHLAGLGNGSGILFREYCFGEHLDGGNSALEIGF